MRINWHWALRTYCNCLWYYKEEPAYWPEEQKKKAGLANCRTEDDCNWVGALVVVVTVSLIFVETTHCSLLALEYLTNKTLVWCQRQPLFSLPMRCAIEKEIVYTKEGHEICDGFPLTKAFEFFMWQILNFCRSGPDLVLISAQLLSRAYGWAWECQSHLFSHSPLPVSHLSHTVRLYLAVSLSVWLYVSAQWPSFVSVIVAFFTLCQPLT